MPNYKSNACAGFTIEDREALWDIAKVFADDRGLVVQIADLVGHRVEWLWAQAAEFGSQLFGDHWRPKITDLIEQALWKAHDVATLGLEPQGNYGTWRWLNKILTVATGATTGFLGLPAVAVDIPVTTLVIMRSIAEIARAKGEDLASDETKRGCLQVLAFGVSKTDDDPGVGYWSIRAAFTNGSIELLIKQAASQLGVVLSGSGSQYE